MMSSIFIGRDAFINYTVSVTGLALIIPSLFWLFFGEREYVARNKTIQKSPDTTTHILFWLVLIPLGVLTAPGSSLIIQKLIGVQPLINTMTAIPTAMVTVYSFIHLVERLNITGKKKVYSIICLAILIVVSSSIYISYDHPLGIHLVSNTKKIEPEVLDICHKVGSDYVMLPEEIYGQIGEYNSKINAGSLHEIAHDKYYAVNVAKTSSETKSPLFVIRKSYDNAKIIEPYGYKKTAETKHYVIYQRSE